MTPLGLESIASYIPAGRISNYARKEQFDIDFRFIDEKIGVREIAVMDSREQTSDLCVRAFGNLQNEIPLDKRDIDVLAVVTQNPDTNVPHVSAIVHGKLDLPVRCACFDISLGCSGFVYGLSIVQSFMKENGFTRGLLFTADPYSKIIDPHDKNTALLFGDAATVTLISRTPVFILDRVTFGTVGQEYGELMTVGNRLSMNGRAVFNFIMKHIPEDISLLLKGSNLGLDDVDRFVFHQGSKFVVDSLAKRLSIDRRKVAFDIYGYGNTVSSSIPIILEKEIGNIHNKKILISGFGGGLSWSSGILERRGQHTG
jgi:3-oxoacyl-[acyl-carrier-protein] synthase III